MRGLGWVVVVGMVAGCGEPTPPPCALALVAEPLPRVEAITADGAHVAFTAETATGVRALFATPASCGDEPVMVEEQVDFAMACGPAIFGFRAATPEVALGMIAWTASTGVEPVELGRYADPGATRCSRDGRYATTEVNDLQGDSIQTVDLMLVRTEDLRAEMITWADHVRARFTHDSRLVVYSGGDPEGDAPRLRYRPVDSGQVSDVTTQLTLDRWEITRDNHAVIHADGNLLVRTNLDGTRLVLSESYIPSPDKALDVSPSGLVAFTGGALGAIELVSATGGDVRRLVDSGAIKIEAHHDGLLFYRDGAATLLGIATAAGGPGPWDLGVEAEVVDEKADAVVTLAPSGRVSWLHAARTETPTVVAMDAVQAAIAYDDRVLVRRTTGAIDLVDPDSLEVTGVAESSLGPFVLAADRRWLAVAADTPSGVSVVQLSIPAP
jgi:hypothetical protein